MNSNDVQEYLIDCALIKDEAKTNWDSATTEEEAKLLELAYARTCACEETLIENGRLF